MCFPDLSSRAGGARRGTSQDQWRRGFLPQPAAACEVPRLAHDDRWARRRITLVLLSLFASAVAATAQPHAIFLVRHAERAPTSGPVPADTRLSPEGRTRAQHLAEALKDAGIAAIFTTEYERTKETAAPLARSSGIRPEAVPAGDLRALIAKIKSASGNVLVVGHSNTLPQIINALGVSNRVLIAESDYDNLFIVLAGKQPELIRLHYR